ncbi:MAG: hypothetical protein Q9166_001601, partial [cf. Caloplaca sp. 2 TL-2023]
MSPPSCPFCPFSNPSPYFVAQHVETFHPETDEPPFVSRHFLEGLPVDCTEATTARDAPSQDYFECECGERLLLSEVEDHAQLHSAESADTAVDMAEIIGEQRYSAFEHLFEPPIASGWVDPTESIAVANGLSGKPQLKPTKPKQTPWDTEKRGQTKAKDWVALLLGPNTSPKKVINHKNAKRLGEAELGPYAHEDKMPTWLHRQLERGARVSLVNQISQGGQLVRLEVVANETRGVLPVLAQLCAQDKMLAKVYLCHSGVQHVFKMAKEGGFCGYRNIQMLNKVSFIQAARSQGHEYFPGRLPSVLDLQELIESAWDRGINTRGRVETGGILDTRKYIGTPETLLNSLNIG